MSRRGRILMVAGLVSLALTGCGNGGGSDFAAEFTIQNISRKAAKAYPTMDPGKARILYANQQFADWKLATPDEARQKLEAAYFFIGFAQMNGRARGEYCGEMNVDIDKFVKGFDRKHRVYYEAAEAALETRGETLDGLYKKNQRYLRAAAKNDLMALAGNLSSTYNVCGLIEEKASRINQDINFAIMFPYHGVGR